MIIRELSTNELQFMLLDYELVDSQVFVFTQYFVHLLARLDSFCPGNSSWKVSYSLALTFPLNLLAIVWKNLFVLVDTQNLVIIRLSD